MILKKEYLQNLSDVYLYKDLLDIGGLKNTSKIRGLLKLLAFQIGSQVSLSELGSTLKMSKDTVGRYLDFLEKSFVIFRLKGLNLVYCKKAKFPPSHTANFLVPEA